MGAAVANIDRPVGGRVGAQALCMADQPRRTLGKSGEDLQPTMPQNQSRRERWSLRSGLSALVTNLFVQTPSILRSGSSMIQLVSIILGSKLPCSHS